MFKYEQKRKPLLSRKKYYKRLRDNFLLSIAIIVVSLAIGIGGYMHFGNLKFVDAVLNASMILGGMGPVDTLTTDAAKYFASFYALYSGITLITSVGILFSPMIHRIMHRFHMETDNDEDENESKSNKR
jgi:hypothetical protein